VKRGRAAAGSALFFAVAPGVVAGLVPWWLASTGTSSPYSTVVRALGVVLFVAGAAVLLHAFSRFVREGLGTPAPIAPTARLVVGGLYRYVRNPMYLAVVTTIVGEALMFGQPRLFWYAAAVATTTALFVRGYEEPTLRRQFGAEYDAYRQAVPGWHPRLRPYHQGSGASRP
jgi:protein-S-isoprenylcysteine O-methyltransferase Ste14